MICRYISTYRAFRIVQPIRGLLFLILMFCSLVLHAALPGQLQKTGNPELYARLMPLAKENLSRLPKALAREYTNLLSEQDDILMAYLIAYEQDYKLAEADPAVCLDNYREIEKLLQSEGLKYSPEFFLSYVARQSVSDERLSAYRKAMLEDGLAEVALISDPLMKYRETANWCVEKLLFMQTSGRDLSPVDITRSSLTGRCEEMQILFVAAARTVGLPSRPASTPWWAHMDNNHAWAEVYLDGQWQYTGDMDAAYFPNQTWFSGMVDKTVMILAEGSLAAAEDEVLIQGRYEAVINSSPNYAGDRSRRVELICVDESGNAIADAQVSIMVYNWGALRPLIILRSDAQGRLGFSAGSGDFFLLAFKDGKQALQMVKASATKIITVELTLSATDLEGFDEILEYPANEMNWQEAPESYREEISYRKELWQNTIDAWEQAAGNSVVPDSLAVIARGNLGELEHFWRQHQPVDEDYIRFLISYDPKFLWQADHQLLEAHYHFWQAQDHSMPPELFYPSVFYEELPRPFIKKGQLSLYPPDFVKSGKTPRQRMDKALKWLNRKYRRDAGKALTGLPRLDVMAQQKYLNDVQYRLLAIYILRANGIPADFTRLPDNILVYIDYDWHYYNLKEGKITTHDGAKGNRADMQIRIRDEFGLPVNAAEAHLGITRFVNGVFYSLNTEIKATGDGNYRLRLPETESMLFFGYRISDSKTALKMLPLRTAADSLNLFARDYPRTWESADPRYLDILNDVELAEVKLVILGNQDQENSLRVAQKLQDLELNFRFLGTSEQAVSRVPGYQYSHAWQRLVRGNPELNLIPTTLYRDEEGWKMYQGNWERLP